MQVLPARGTTTTSGLLLSYKTSDVTEVSNYQAHTKLSVPNRCANIIFHWGGVTLRLYIMYDFKNCYTNHVVSIT
jgi:hypothetical protein